MVFGKKAFEAEWSKTPNDKIKMKISEKKTDNPRIILNKTLAVDDAFDILETHFSLGKRNMAVTLGTAGKDKNKSDEDGLPNNHQYELLKVQTVMLDIGQEPLKLRLFQVRNPHGKVRDWKGRFSWNSLPQINPTGVQEAIQSWVSAPTGDLLEKEFLADQLKLELFGEVQPVVSKNKFLEKFGQPESVQESGLFFMTPKEFFFTFHEAHWVRLPIDEADLLS